MSSEATRKAYSWSGGVGGQDISKERKGDKESFSENYRKVKSHINFSSIFFF